MNKEIFLKQFADLFDETNSSEISYSTVFRDLDEWGSLISMSLIAMVKTEYGKSLTGKDMRDCETVEDLFNLIKNK